MYAAIVSDLLMKDKEALEAQQRNQDEEQRVVEVKKEQNNTTFDEYTNELKM